MVTRKTENITILSRGAHVKMRAVMLLAYMGLIFILSSVPETTETEPGRLLSPVAPGVQNLLHIPAYGLLALLWILTLGAYGVAERRGMYVSLVVAAGYGAVTELYQIWVPGRVASVWDVLFNLTGILLFIWLYHCAIRNRHAV